MNPYGHRPPSRRWGPLRSIWPWYDRFAARRDARRAARRTRGSSDVKEGVCDACCSCDLFHLSLIRVVLLAAPTRTPRRKVTVPARAGLGAIRGYQRWVSHRLPTCCRHTPSCSHYGLAVVRRYGLLQGARLAGGRIARCTPTVAHGTADPPP